MSKALFFNIPAQGHINPTLPVIGEMVRRGEQVVCINLEGTRAAYEATGAQFIPYPHLAQMDTMMDQASGGNLTDNALALIKLAELIMPWVLDLLEREKPDYVIFDSLASWAKQATEKLGIRAVGSITTFAFKPDTLPSVPIASMLSMIRSAALRMPAYWQVASRMRRKFGVKGVGLMGALNNASTFNIVFTSALLQPNSEKLQDAYRFVGPSIAARPASGDFPFDAITRSPVVYISLGTINNDNMEFYRQCFEAFGTYDAQFILSAGKRTDIKALGAIPDNFIVRNFVPQLEVLQRSDLFITHGGMNSVHEGLYYNVPLVVIPQQFEQSIVAQQVVKHGAGVALADTPPFGQVSAADLRQAVDTVMRSRAQYHAAAVLLGESLRAAGGFQRAAEEFIAFGQRKH